MKKIRQNGLYGAASLFLLGFMVTCSTISFLKVNYHLPVTTSDLKGKSVFLSFEDARQNQDLLGEGARQDFKNFSNNISFSVSQGTGDGYNIGVFDLPSLFLEAFKRRFEALGIEVVQKKNESQIEIKIVLTAFLLDQVGRSWTFDMGYDARLIKGGNMLAKQMISGQSERVKLLGLREADILVGESFTGLANQLDLERLFQQAGL
jgi:hypothetical protein